MVSIKFILSKRKRTFKGVVESELLLRLSIDRLHVFRSKTGIFIPTHCWDEEKQKIKIPRIKTNESTALAHLQKQINHLIEFLTDAAIRTPAVKQTKKWLANLIIQESSSGSGSKVSTAPIESPSSFFDTFDSFIASQCVGKRVVHFKSLKRILMRFEKYIDNKLDLNTLDSDTIDEFKDFLEKEHTFFNKKGECVKHKEIYNSQNLIQIPKQRGGNAIHSLLKKLRTFCLWAQKMKKTGNNPFATYRLSSCVYGSPFFITSEERNKLYDYKFKSGSLSVQRDIFVFQSNVGMRYGDLCDLTKRNIVNDAIEYVANKTRNKTGRIVRVPLTQQAKEIIAKYDSDDRIELLPFISQQKYNQAIKEMLQQADISRVVTIINPTTRREEQHPIWKVASSHMARRNFIGNLYNKTPDPSIICSLTGHTEGSRAFERYRAIDDVVKKNLIDKL